jgi:hypothetical protein
VKERICIKLTISAKISKKKRKKKEDRKNAYPRETAI